MKTTLKILFLFFPFISHSQANLGAGFFGKVGINVGSTSPTERLKVNGTSAFVGLGTFSGGLTATGTVSLPSTTSIGGVSSTEISYINGLLSPAQTQLDTVLAIANRKSRILITNVEIVSPNPADYATYDYVFDTAAGKIYKYEYRSPPELPSFSEIGDFTTKEEVASAYAPINNPTFTTNSTSPKYTITGTGYIANGSDVSMGAGSTADIVTYNPTGRILFSTNGFVRAAITNAGNFGIGTIAPTAKFELSGLDAFKYVTGTQGADKVLLSNASGVASWGLVSLTAGVTGILPVANGGTGISSFGSGIQTFLGTPSSANLATALTDETGTGAVVFANNSTLTGTTNIATIANTLGANFATTSGNVGVGVNPTVKLHVAASTINSDIAIFTGANTNRGLKISTGAATSNDDLVRLNAQTSTGEISFQVNSVDRVRINANGFGINTAVPNSALHINSTGAITIPVGTDAQRPASPATGMLRVNTTPATPKLEYYNGTAWIQL